MATTAEIMVGGIALFVNTIVIVVSYFVGNSVLAPILGLASKWNIHPLLLSSMWETSYLYSSFFTFLLVFEFILIVAFVIILARRQVSPFDY